MNRHSAPAVALSDKVSDALDRFLHVEAISGIVLLPIAIYLVGQAVFGDYGGQGFSDFYASLHYELRQGQKVTWYLVLSPYLGWQLFRLTIYAFRKLRHPPSLTGS